MFPKLFNFSDSKEKSYLVEFNVLYLKKTRFMAYRKFYWIIFPQTLYRRAIVNGACMQKIKMGHRAKFRAKNKCFPQILFPVSRDFTQH